METQKKSVLQSTSAALIALVLLAVVGLMLYSGSKPYSSNGGNSQALYSSGVQPDSADGALGGFMFSSGSKLPSPTKGPTSSFQAKVDVVSFGSVREGVAKEVDVEIVTKESGKQTFTKQTLPFTKSFSGQSKNDIVVTAKNISETGDVHVTLTMKERWSTFYADSTRGNFGTDSTRGSFCSGGSCSVTVRGQRPGHVH